MLRPPLENVASSPHSRTAPSARGAKTKGERSHLACAGENDFSSYVRNASRPNQSRQGRIWLDCALTGNDDHSAVSRNVVRGPRDLSVQLARPEVFGYWQDSYGRQCQFEILDPSNG
jgi:hypothetical protein